MNNPNFSKKLKEKHKLIIIGNYGWGKNRLDQKIKYLNMKKYIKILKNIDDKQLAKLYARSKYLIFPSIYEGFGLPIIESINASTPVICSNLDPMKTISKDCALFFNPYSIDSMKNSIEKSESSKIYSVLYKNCIKRKFISWDDFVQNLIKNLN